MVLAIELKSTVPEPTRSIALMALLGIALVGLLLIVVTMLGASWVRKQGKHRRGPAVPPDVFVPGRRTAHRDMDPSRRPPNEPLSSRETIVDDGPGAADDTLNS